MGSGASASILSKSSSDDIQNLVNELPEDKFQQLLTACKNRQARPAANSLVPISKEQISGTSWGWAHDGAQIGGGIMFLPNGHVKWKGGRESEGTWSIDTNTQRLHTTFNGVTHVLRVEGDGLRAVLESPERSPPSKMFLNVETPPLHKTVIDGDVISLVAANGQILTSKAQGKHGTPGERRWHLWYLTPRPDADPLMLLVKGTAASAFLLCEEENAGLEVDCGKNEAGTTMWLGKHGKTDAELTPIGRHYCLFEDGTLSPKDAQHLVLGVGDGKVRGEPCLVLVPRGASSRVKFEPASFDNNVTNNAN